MNNFLILLMFNCQTNRNVHYQYHINKEILRTDKTSVNLKQTVNPQINLGSLKKDTSRYKIIIVSISNKTINHLKRYKNILPILKLIKINKINYNNHLKTTNYYQ